MKLLIIAAIAASILSAAEATVAPATELPKPTERSLTEVELLKTRLANQTVQLIRKKYDIDKAEQEMQPAQQEYTTVVIEACKSVGVALDKIQTECGFTTGRANDDTVQKGPDGKPVPAKVWKIVPAQSATETKESGATAKK